MSNLDHQPGGEAARPEGSVALAVAKLQQGDGSELERMVGAFHPRLLARARAKLRKAPHLRSVTDDEGAVSSALGSYYWRARDGKFPQLRHREELLKLLITMIDRKVAHQIRDHSTPTAGGGKVQNEPESGFDAPGRQPSPEEVAMGAEAIEMWRRYMADKELLDVAELTLIGVAYWEIAVQLGITESSARRSVTRVNKLTQEFARGLTPEE